MTTTTTATTTTDHAATFRALRADLVSRFVERDEVVTGMLVAALAGEHVAMVGSPGTAKSAVANAMCGAIDGADWFAYLLSRFTTPDEILGPFSLRGLQEDRFTRSMSGKLPTAHIAFLDEAFKANSSLLNALLGALNERVIYDDGKAVRIPLRLCVAASNEYPSDPELAALWDRFALRFHVDRMRDPANRRALLGRIADGSQSRSTTARLSMDVWDAARAAAAALPVSAEALDALIRLDGELTRSEITISDRRWGKCVGILRASAYLEGDAEVSEDHLGILGDVLWDAPEQRPTIVAAIARVAMPAVGEAREIHEAILGLLASTGASNRDSAAVSMTEIKKAAKRIDGIRKTARPGSRSDAAIASMLDDLRARYDALRSELIKGMDL